jgi:serine/threonine protein kinase
MEPVRQSQALTPEQFGPYEVYERLGMGGMASVHRAKKRGPAGFERTVALKRMLSHLTEDRNFVDSFVREAKITCHCKFTATAKSKAIYCSDDRTSEIFDAGENLLAEP